MSSLVDKSLIQQRQQNNDEPRFRMLETIRSIRSNGCSKAAKKLPPSGRMPLTASSWPKKAIQS
jgi:hypothetical protein